MFEVIVDQSAFVPEESVEEQKTKEDGSGLPANELACRKVVGGKKAGERRPLILFPFCRAGFCSFVYTSFVCVCVCAGQMSALGVTPQLSPPLILRLRSSLAWKMPN